jgi:hypothetical protein
MKTIGFYSYKGGTGKSLCAANFAVCLSRLGYSTLLVDADVLGPSLHHKFDDGGSVAPGKGGLLNLVSASFDKDAWMKRSLDDVVPRDPVDVHNYVYQLDTPRDPVRERFEKRFGSIHILPAGDVTQSEYWQTVRSPLWHELFTLFDRYATRQVSKDAYDVFLEYLLKIKAALGERRIDIDGKEHPPIDYLLVDFGSGAGEMSTTLINAWVDTLVYMLPFNDENINYLKGTFGKMADAGEARYRMGISEAPFYIEVVLARVPASIQFRGDSRLERALRARHFDVDDMLVLHSDRDLEMGEEIRCGYQTLPQNRRLTHDYLKLFGVLMEEEHVPGYGPEDLPEAIGFHKHFEETERVFIHEKPYGTLINPNDNSRNVSFKVSTFQNLLQGFTRGVTKALAESNGDSEEGSCESSKDTLGIAGRRCGEEFGKDLGDMMSKSGRHVGVQERVQKWTEFDSDVGFGRFVCDEDTIEIKGKRLVECDIYLLESFLTPATDTSLDTPGDHRFCSLMTGYIEGVFSLLFNMTVKVDHKHYPVEKLPKHIQDETGYSDEVGSLTHRDPVSECCQFHISALTDVSKKKAGPDHDQTEVDTSQRSNTKRLALN